MKKLKDCLKELKPEHYKKAIENTPSKNLNKMVEDLKWALSTAFEWDGSPEGFDYWKNIHYCIVNGIYHESLSSIKRERNAQRKLLQEIVEVIQGSKSVLSICIKNLVETHQTKFK